MPKLTKKVVDASAADPAKRVYLWDSELTGFGLQVLQSGTKSYVLQFRNADGKESRITIARHGVLTCEEARVKAAQMKRAIIEGGDPAAERKERRNAATVADVLDRYLESESFASKAVGTQKSDRGRIERHLRPLLGKTKVDTGLTPEAIDKAYREIRDGKTAVREKVGYRALARVTGGEGAARKSIRLLKSILAWAVRERIVKTNPLTGFKTGTDGVRDVILDGADDYAKLFKTLDTMEQERRIRQPVADAIRVIALTGARRSEIAALRWRHVDLKAGLLVLPPLENKGGRMSGKPRTIGLPAVASAIINRQARGGADSYVFAPSHGDGPLVLSKPWIAIRDEAGLPAGLGLHGLRHSLATGMALRGANASTISAALGHRSIVTSAKYVHMAQSRQQAIAEEAAATVLAGIAVSTSSKTENVLPLRVDRK